MKTYKMKRIVVGVLLVILTLGFCVVGTGAAHADQMGGPMNQQQGFGPGGRQGGMGQMGGPGGQMGRQGGPNGGQNDFMDQQGYGPDGQNSSMGGQDFNGQTPPDSENIERDGESFPDGDFGPGGENEFSPDGQPDSNGQFSRDGGFGPGNQRDFGGHGGPGRDGGPQGMDDGVREAIDALEDGETKTNLETLMENVHTAMEALHDADDDSREAAETSVKEARDALNSALEEAGIDASMNEPPEKPEDGDDTARPERPENGNQNRPENGGRQNGPDFLSWEALEDIDLEDEEQVENLFQQFLTWLKGSNT